MRVRTDKHDITFSNNVLSITERKTGAGASIAIPVDARAACVDVLTNAKEETQAPPKVADAEPKPAPKRKKKPGQK